MAKPREDAAAVVSALLREAARDATDEEREALEAWLDAHPEAALEAGERDRLLDVWHNPNAPYQEQRKAAQRLAAYDLELVLDFTVPRRPKPTNEARRKNRRTPVTAHGNRYDGPNKPDPLDAVRKSGAKSKPQYEAWRAVQSKPSDWPTYKTIQRTMSGKTGGIDHRKPGESAWSAAVRLARKRKP